MPAAGSAASLQPNYPVARAAQLHSPRAGKALWRASIQRCRWRRTGLDGIFRVTYFSCRFGHHNIKKILKLLERFQRREAKMVKSLDGKPYEEQLRSPDLVNMERMRLRRDLIAVYNFHMRRRGEADTDLFSVVTSDMTRRNGLKLFWGGLGWILEKGFSSQRSHHSTSLTEFKEHLDNGLGHRILGNGTVQSQFWTL
ncbi:hypothetical protein DUI87_16037 [Hirundo rustica rustica]|uniref:Uncharacterized protein n=1 Tax=Hirundo rustica rustica TaxID=333673 RepID=A0A3M0K6A0_HIRRU|nr:hypothetical protein DUI87_16037 [Hirundo rustica rustica]